MYFVFLIVNGYPGFTQDTIQDRKDTLAFKGQASVWGNYNINNALSLQIGSRYIPILDYGIRIHEKRLIDFEGAADLYGSISTKLFDSILTDDNIRIYRAWARFSTNQLELRLGLQKINFGSATILRPLMWFDQIDPRDPLQITNGVWGILGRYYFLNNANAWLWCLYGNDKLRPWKVGKTDKNIPEFGGRYQHPVKKGELALSYHHRNVDMNDFVFTSSSILNMQENSIGIDGKWDLGVGFWFEGCWNFKTKKIDDLTNQEIFNIGADNTISVGNGLHIVVEQLLISSDKQAFGFENPVFFSGLSMNYPLGMIDNLNAIVYYDQKNNQTYNFLNWNHQFKYLSFFLMAYWNPNNYQLPLEGNSENFYAGPGMQIMLVYNH